MRKVGNVVSGIGPTIQMVLSTARVHFNGGSRIAARVHEGFDKTSRGCFTALIVAIRAFDFS